jgi:uncharacterized membrane protein
LDVKKEIKMVQTIGNPLSWMAQAFGSGSTGLASAVHELGGAEDGPVTIRDITIPDLREALRKGAADFMAMRTDVMFIVFVYPVIGLFLFWLAVNRDAAHLFFPFVSGFALLGPVALIGLYEMSRRREMGLETGWIDGFRVLSSPAIAPIFALGVFLAFIFVFWMVSAHIIFNLTLGPEPPASLLALVQSAVFSVPGWVMIVLGCAVGLVFAVVVLVVSLVSFPLLIDRHVGLPVAVVTSVNIAIRNPVTVAAWGGIVVALLGIGFATLFVGMIFVLPLIGHATWHLYRLAVVPLTVNQTTK